MSQPNAGYFSPHQGEFTLQEGVLHRGGIGACAGDFGGLPASEGDFVNEVFASGGAAGFPCHEDMGGDETADGRCGVAEELSRFFHGNAPRGGEIYD